jgi:hypothetical protein
VIQTTHDLPAASAALDAAIATPKRGDLGASLSELEPRIKAALKAKMTPTSIAKILKANGVNASVDGLRRYVKAVADGTKRPRKPSVKSSQNGKANRPLAQTTVVESPAKIPTGDGFFHAEDVDN